MKKLFVAATFFVAGAFGVNAQIQKNHWMVGGEVANFQFTNGLNIGITPKAGYFIKDNWAVGAEAGLNIIKAKGANVTTTNWNLGAFTRYYIGKNYDNILKNGTFFGEISAGFGGTASQGASSTNGLQLGFGAGYAYFITPSVSLNALVKLNTTVGAGSNTATIDLPINVGFQIYLPTKKVNSALKDQ